MRHEIWERDAKEARTAEQAEGGPLTGLSK